MVRLITSYYKSKVAERDDEINICLSNNILCENIDEIILFSEISVLQSEDITVSQKVSFHPYNGKVSFSDYISFANSKITDKSDITIICNSDIFFTQEDVALIKKHIGINQVYALSRWDIRLMGESELFDRWDSQDAWVFLGEIKPVKDCDFTAGIAGCDNAFAERLKRSGYTVLNPSKTIRSYHLHIHPYRGYVGQKSVDKPYLLITPHKINIRPQYKEIR